MMPACKFRAVARSAFLAAILLSAASQAQATCLSMSQGMFWNNGCNVGVFVIWNDEQYCSSNNRAKYPCAAYVGPYSTSSAGFTGYVNWHECQSPGGNGDVLTIEDGWGNVVCKD